MGGIPEVGSELPVAVTIAGSDSGGGAGIQADLLTFAALDAFGTTAITCLTAQNPDGVSAVEAMAPDFVRAQLDQLRGYFRIRAIKTGMLFNVGIVEVVSAFLRETPDIPVVVDPVMVATSGAVLLQEDAVAAIRSQLLPLAALITPNLDEAAVLLGYRPADRASMRAAARELAEQLGANVLLKGGHLEGDEILDILHLTSGKSRVFEHPRVPDVDTHGSGCTLSAAIAARLAQGDNIEQAVEAGLAYLMRTLQSPLRVSGRLFMAH